MNSSTTHSSKNSAIVRFDNRTHLTNNDLAKDYPGAYVSLCKQTIKQKSQYAHKLLSHQFYNTEYGQQFLPELLSTAIAHNNFPIAHRLQEHYQPDMHLALIRRFCCHVFSDISEREKSTTITAIITSYRMRQTPLTQHAMEQLYCASRFYNDNDITAKLIEAARQ
jgi:hypothetical protein